MVFKKTLTKSQKLDKKRLHKRRKCVYKCLYVLKITSPSEIRKHLYSIDHIAANKYQIFRDIKYCKDKYKKELAEAKRKEESRRKWHEARDRKKAEREVLPFGKVSKNEASFESQYKEFKPSKPKCLRQKKDGLERTRPCPKCGRVYKLERNPIASVLCASCGYQYDRKNKTWIML